MAKRESINIELATTAPVRVPWVEQQSDHDRKLQQYFHTFRMRNFSSDTSSGLAQFITGFFRSCIVQDTMHPAGARTLFYWELMNPHSGSEYVAQFNESLIAAGLKLKTRHKYIKDIRYFCEFVLAHLELPGSTDGQTVITKYGPIKQPVSKYNHPPHAPDDEESERYVLSSEQRDSFYEFIRCDCIRRSRRPHLTARDYTMIIAAGDGGFRISELTHLHAQGPNRDIDYINERIRTRWGKGATCRGKRTRWSFLTQRAVSALQVYEAHVRPVFPEAKSSPELFLSAVGGPLSYDGCRERLEKIVKAARQAGLELPAKLRWHDLRRTFATLFLEEHPDQFWLLMKIMGHSTRGTMSSYVLIDDETFQYTTNRVLSRYISAHSQERSAA